MSSLIDEGQNEPPLTYRGLVKAKIVDLLSSSDDHHTTSLEIWTAINQLLNQLPVSTLADRCSPEDDPMGRLLVGDILSKDPPIATLECALRAFPCSLHQNPAAFFIACRDTSTEIVSLMMRHVVSGCYCNGSDDDECPYPWLISEHITTDAAQAILEACPEGVLKQSPILSGSCLLDYFLLSPDMVEQRSFDMTLWSKFKLVLLASSYCWDRQLNGSGSGGGSCLSPVHTILGRVFSTPDFFSNMEQAKHVLWLIHQLRSTDRWVFEKQAHDGKCPLHYVLSQKCDVSGEGLVIARELVKILLEANPGCAKGACNGRLALHMAIENGWPCHDLLLAVYPEALDIKDPVTDLFPFQTSATVGGFAFAQRTMKKTSPAAAAGMVDIRDLDVTYELLRANPTHASGMMPSSNETRVGAQA